MAIDLQTGELQWRTDCDGYRSDHAALSPDGKTFLVSCSTAKNVIGIDTATGTIVDRFQSGTGPHENIYLNGGNTIVHANIGSVFKGFSFFLDWFDLNSIKPDPGRFVPESFSEREADEIVARVKAGEDVDFDEAEQKWLDARIKDKRSLHIVQLEKTDAGEPTRPC